MRACWLHVGRNVTAHGVCAGLTEGLYDCKRGVESLQSFKRKCDLNVEYHNGCFDTGKEKGVLHWERNGKYI